MKGLVKVHMTKITRRKFIRETAALGAGLAVAPHLLQPFAGAEGSGDEPSSLLLLPPFLGRPTRSSITMNVVAGKKDIECYISFRKLGQADSGMWEQTPETVIPALAPKEITLQSLALDTAYRYRLHARLSGSNTYQVVTEKEFRTQRSNSQPFSFAMLSDSHITPFHNNRLELLSRISASIAARKPDFFFMLGDNIQTPSPYNNFITSREHMRGLYALLRSGLGELPSSVPGFTVIGNWDGENGWQESRQRWAREGRKSLIPNPGPKTYPEGGSEQEDYYSFTWGDVLCLALNVTGYTMSDHTLESPIGKADDWTLGEEQKSWLLDQLKSSNATWKLLFMHHTVGGKGGNEVDSRYGRGGGRAAKVGEQAVIHRWMQACGAQALFYGHDHVFTNMTVDDIHYVCVGSAGAPWKFPTSTTGYEEYKAPSGYTWVDVTDNGLNVSFITVDSDNVTGTVIHRFTIHPS